MIYLIPAADFLCFFFGKGGVFGSFVGMGMGMDGVGWGWMTRIDKRRERDRYRRGGLDGEVGW